jgi:NADH:ubiquinone oxidoreductase subunit 6 (subunit J)
LAPVVFFIAAIGAVTGAVGVVALRNPFYSVLALVCHLLALAALFLLLRAEFVAAAQVVVYAGAVMVLYVFVVAYVGGSDEPLADTGPSLHAVAPFFAVALFAELSIAILGSGLDALSTEGTNYFPGFGSPEEIGRLLLTDFLLPFEVASYLLLVAAVGAVMLARRRRGLDDEGEHALSVSELFGPRPAETGTMAEGVGALARQRADAKKAAAAAAEERGGW